MFIGYINGSVIDYHSYGEDGHECQPQVEKTGVKELFRDRLFFALFVGFDFLFFVEKEMFVDGV